jgi:hypothetical protein
VPGFYDYGCNHFPYYTPSSGCYPPSYF